MDAGRAADFGFSAAAFVFALALAFAGAALTAAAFFAAGFATADFLATGFLAIGSFADGFFAAGFATLRGLADFLPGTVPADFFAGFAADLRTDCAEPRDFAPCFALLPEVFFVLAATHCLLATALRSGFQSYFDVAR